MLKRYYLIIFLLSAGLGTQAQQTGGRQTNLFDKDWLFLKGDDSGADKTAFNDSKWRKLDVPHDWSIEGPYDAANPTGRGGGYLPAGIGWYRKHFEMDAAGAAKRVFIHFDGVMANSDVWINGFHLGKRPYGFISFEYELTGHLNFGKGKDNVLAVKADNALQPTSRFYTGAGIYRHVHLIITDPVHIEKWGVFVTTPQVSADKATVHVKTTIDNQGRENKKVMLRTAVMPVATAASIDTKASAVTKDILFGQSGTVDEDITITKPELWSTDKPAMYQVVSTVLVDNKVVDSQTTYFGIRDAKFDADQGFLLNGKKVMIKGVCLHADGGAVGAAVPLGVWKRRLEILKAVGVNGIRTSHNPVAPEFLDLCDKMGFLVMDENFDTWEVRKSPADNGYEQFFKEWWDKDTRDMVLRDRNHPSLVIYSVGNEIHDSLSDSAGFKKYRDMQNLIHQLDGTRPVTMALFRPNTSGVYANGFAKMMDVVGQNYRETELVAAHTANPTWKVIGTENGHTLSAWLPLRDHAYVAGQFLWTGFDYLGEAVWPNVVNGQAIFDRVGTARPIGYQRESWWSDKPNVHIVRKLENEGAGPFVADWTPLDQGTYDDARVSVYSNCDEVELFLNGKSLGAKTKPADDSPRDWKVTFEKGNIKAVAKNKGQVVATDELKTAEDPAKILLSVDHAKINNNWDDVVYVTATVVDANGVPCPQPDKVVNFSISGPGVIAATDNGDIANHDIYSIPARKTYKGKCIAIIKASAASGKITVKAASVGLADGVISIDVVK